MKINEKKQSNFECKIIVLRANKIISLYLFSLTDEIVIILPIENISARAKYLPASSIR